AHQVGRLPARPADLDDLARPLRLADDVAAHVEPVPDGCLHQPTSSPASARSPGVRGRCSRCATSLWPVSTSAPMTDSGYGYDDVISPTFQCPGSPRGPVPWVPR